MNKMKKILWIMICLATAMTVEAQQQGIVRTLERPGKPSEGISGVTINVLEYPNAIVTKKGGKFSFALQSKRQGDSYTVSRVQKKGYTLVDKQLKGRRYAYSPSVPIEIVLVADEQLEMDKKRIEDKAYARAQKSYDKRIAALEKQLKEKTISEQEYRSKYEEMSSNYNNYVQLIDQMAERYATTDYKGLSDISRKTLECIENADLEQADELINSKGDFDKREQELANKIELQEKSEQLAQQLQDDITVEVNDLIQDYYNKFTINLSEYHNDSAAYYLERILRYMPNDVQWLKYTATFIMERVSDYPRAEKYYQQALEQAKLQYGEQSELVGSIGDKLGLLYDYQLDYDKAIEWHQKALDILEPIVGTDNDDVSMAYTLIGRAYLYKNNPDSALRYTVKGMEIRERMNIDDPQLSQSYNNMGVIYNHLGDSVKAMEYHLKALAIREQAFGSDHVSTALSYLNIGDLDYTAGRYDKAMEWYKKALVVYEKQVGPFNPYTASCYNSIAAAYYQQGDYAQTIEWYNKLADSYEKLYGAAHNTTLSCYNRIAALHELTGNNSQALEIYQQIVNILEKQEDSSQESIDAFKNKIEELKAK